MENQEPQQPGFWQIVLSTLSAAFGVQSRKNQERDFKGRSIMPYVVAGAIFTLVFIGSVMLLVKWVLSSVQ